MAVPNWQTMLACLFAFPAAAFAAASGAPLTALLTLLSPVAFIAAYVCRDSWRTSVTASSRDWLRRQNLESFGPLAALLTLLTGQVASAVGVGQVGKLSVSGIGLVVALLLALAMLYDIRVGRKSKASGETSPVPVATSEDKSPQ